MDINTLSEKQIINKSNLSNLSNLSNSSNLSNLSLSVITYLVNINSLINLKMIAINLPLNNIFVGKKLHGIISEGNVKNYSKKHKIKKDFSNQLTIIVKVPNTFICSTDNIEYDTKANESIKNRKRKYIEDDKEYFNVNLKIFGNGKIIITGCLTKDEV